MHFKSTLVVCLILCYQISCVAAASECTGAILASVFGTLGTLLVIAAIAALVWYCCRKRSGKTNPLVVARLVGFFLPVFHRALLTLLRITFVLFCRDIVVRVFCRHRKRAWTFSWRKDQRRWHWFERPWNTSHFFTSLQRRRTICW